MSIYDEVTCYRRNAERIAKDLKYPKSVQERLRSCTTIGQISAVMTKARIETLPKYERR